MYYKVILIEDEDIIRNGIKYSIDWHSLNCHVIADTDSSTEALSLIKDFKPDILISDINMPVMNGLQLIKEASNFHNFSSVIISGYNNFEYAKEAIELGVVKYISKPIDHKELVEGVQCAIDKIQDMKKIERVDEKTSDDIDVIYNKITYKEESQEILNYIHDNFDKRINMITLSEVFGYSDSTINSRLKESVGTTFNQYLNNYRIDIAINEIKKDPTINLQQLSYDVGITNYKHFSYVFKKYTGYSPREYIIKYIV